MLFSKKRNELKVIYNCYRLQVSLLHRLKLMPLQIKQHVAPIRAAVYYSGSQTLLFYNFSNIFKFLEKEVNFYLHGTVLKHCHKFKNI